MRQSEMKSLKKGQQNRLRKYIASKSDLECDFLMSLIEERIDYSEDGSDLDDLLLISEVDPDFFKSHHSAIATLERERAKIKNND